MPKISALTAGSAPDGTEYIPVTQAGLPRRLTVEQITNYSAAALTRISDTNVTLTLGGTPTTAMLKATSITVGWSGTLAASRGGFGADVSASSGVPLFATGTATFTSTTGTGNFVRATSPTLVTPALGTPASGTLTNCTGLPLLDTAGSAYAQIDSDSSSTDAVFQVRKDSATAGDGTLLFEVNENGQVVVGTTTVNGNRKFYVQQVDTSTDANAGHAAIECRQDYQPSAGSSANPDGIYGTLWYNSAQAFTGAGAAVRGNAYTISQGVSSVDVTNLIGVYGRPRQEAAGTVTNAISLFADGAQTTAGTMTNAMALWVDSQTAATNNYGVYFENNPNSGSIAAASNVDISYKTTGTGQHIWQTASTTPATLGTNGQFTLTPTSNTNMRISYRGSDGTTRVANITLA